MAIDFPNSPTTNQTYTVGDRKWVYDGEKWTVVPASPELLVVGATAPVNTNVIWADTTIAGTMNSIVPSGALMPFAGSTAPTGWLLCFGQTLSRTTYPDLFSVVGTTYNTGGEAGTDFRLPDMRGRVPAGEDDMGGTAANRITSAGSGINGAALGATGGTQNHTLTSSEMPSHTHIQNAHTHIQDSHGHAFIAKWQGSAPVGVNMSAPSFGNAYGLDSSYIAGSTATNQNTTPTNQSTGGGEAHNITQPTIILNYIIKT
jgi:microcystin-dependent protein